MRWRIKAEKPDPQEGDYRVLIKFAWLPITIGGQRVWLENYKQIEFYCRKWRHVPYLGFPLQYLDWDKVELKVIDYGLPKFENPPTPPPARISKSEA